MENEGQTKMVLENMKPEAEAAEPVIPTLTVEEQNELLAKYEKEILSKPILKIGQYAVASELGLKVGVLKEGERVLITRIGNDVAEDTLRRTGCSGQNVELQLFNEYGHLVKRALDSRFLKGVK